MKHIALCDKVARGPSWACSCNLWPKTKPPVPQNRTGACCPKAKPMACVCEYAWECPDHGVKHIGTHD